MKSEYELSNDSEGEHESFYNYLNVIISHKIRIVALRWMYFQPLGSHTACENMLMPFDIIRVKLFCDHEILVYMSYTT